MYGLNVCEDKEDTFIDPSSCVYGNVISIEYLVNYLSRKQSLPTDKLNIYLNFGNFDSKKPMDIVSNYEKVLQSMSGFADLLQHHSFLQEHINEINFTWGGHLCEGSFEWRIGTQPNCSSVKYETHINEYFSNMLMQIKHTNVTKLKINLCGDAVITGLLPILSKTKLTHLKLNVDKPELLDRILDVLPKTNLIHLVCKESFASALAIKNLCKTLPTTNLRTLYIAGISGNINERIEAIEALCNVLPVTKLAWVYMPSVGKFFDEDVREQLKLLSIKINETIPKTNLVKFQVFGDKLGMGMPHILEQDKTKDAEIKFLCENNFKENKEAIELWFKIFKRHIVKSKDKPLISEDVCKNIITFLYPKAISAVNDLSEHIDNTVINEKSYHSKYLLERHQLNIVKINSKLKTNHATSIEHLLRIAARKGDVETINLLLSNNINIDVNQPGELTGKTALHQAVIGVTEKFVCNNYVLTIGVTEEMIHSSNEEISSYDNFRVVNEYHCCIAALLDRGAIEVKDNQGKLPRDYAVNSEQASKMITSLLGPIEFFGEQFSEQEGKENESIHAKLIPHYR